jgi:Leucine-rich repeat (LRR) protein
MNYDNTYIEQADDLKESAKQWASLILMLLMFGSLTLGQLRGSTLSGEGKIVMIPDAYLEAVIRRAIDKPSGNILDTDLVGVGFASLSANSASISDLSGLESCTDLTVLSLWNNSISDLSPLSGMTSLTRLHLGGNQISDLRPLSGLISLTELGLNGNQISDVRPLSGMTSLTRLYLGGNQISDVRPLSGMTSLTELGLSDNPLSQQALCVDIPLIVLRTSIIYDGECSGEDAPHL